MNKKSIRSAIHTYFSKKKNTVFVYLFGSFINSQKFRDVDIAIYTEPKEELIQLGLMQADISRLTGKKVDLISLNNLGENNPLFAYEIVTKGELLFTIDTEKHTNYKKNVLLRYFDTALLRKNIDGAFAKRLESNKFGQRNYE